MRDPRNEYEPFVVVDRVDDPVVADMYAIVVAAGELGDAGRSWILGEAVDRRPDPFASGTVKAPIGASRRRVETNLVGPLRRSLLPNVCPRHRELRFIACLEGREAVLEVLEALDEIRVALDVDEDPRQAAALRDVEHLVGVAERVELPTETSA